METFELLMIRGGFSQEMVDSDFFRWWTEAHYHGGDCYLLSAARTDDRDKVFEAWVKAQGLGPEARALLLAGAESGQVIIHRNGEDTTLREFLEDVKYKYPLGSIVPKLIDVLIKCGIPVKHISDAGVADKHIADIEDGIKIMVRLKQGGKRKSLPFEGRYDNTDDGCDKFWEVHFTGDGKFRASWGPRVNYPNIQGYKDYTESEAASLAREKITKGSYVKVS